MDLTSPAFDSLPKQRPVWTEKCVVRQWWSQLVLLNTDVKELTVRLGEREVLTSLISSQSLPRDLRSIPAPGRRTGMTWMEPHQRLENLLLVFLELPSPRRIFHLHSVPVQFV